MEKKAESVIKRIKGKAKRRRVQRDIPNRVCDFSMLWEGDIYSHTVGKDVWPDLELLTGYSIDVSEWMEFEFYDIVWFWNNQSDDTEQILGLWSGLSHRVGSDRCYWILSDKGKVLSQLTVQHLTTEEPRDPDFQEQIYDYHSSLEDVLGSEEFGTSFDGYESFINDDEEVIAKGDTNVEGYKVPPD